MYTHVKIYKCLLGDMTDVYLVHLNNRLSSFHFAIGKLVFNAEISLITDEISKLTF